MRLKTLGALAGIALVLVSAAYAAWQLGWLHAPFTPAARCRVDAAANPAERKAAEAAALVAVDDLLSGRPAVGYGRLSRAARASATEAVYGAAAERVRAMGAFGPRRAAHAYLISNAALGAVHCGEGDLGAEVSTRATARQAHVLLTAPLGPNRAVFTLWLEREDGAWRTNAFYAGADRLQGADGKGLWALAVAARARGDAAEARRLGDLALSTLDRGPDFRLDLRARALREIGPAAGAAAPSALGPAR